jgi:hypothetical protein
MLANVEALFAVRACCKNDRPLPAELRRWLAYSLGRYLEHDCDNLNEAFGVIQGHGGVPWWRERAIRERDAALRELARRHFGARSVYGRAKLVVRLSERYAATCWPRDQMLERMPERYAGTPKEQLWRAFRSGAKMPVSERRLRTLLGD